MGHPIIRMMTALALLATTACGSNEEVGSDKSNVRDNADGGKTDRDSEKDDGEEDEDDDDRSGDEAADSDAPGSRADASADTDESEDGDDEPTADAGSADDASSDDDDDDDDDAGDGDSAPGVSCLKGSGDYTKDGPYKVKKRDITIGSQGPYTLFYPDPLDSDCKHPIVAWGNGTGVTGSSVYAFFQEHAASWGIVVVAAHNSNTGSGAFHTEGLDYLIEQGKDSSSEFYGKLSDVAGTAGHSQGGGGANAGAKHPNVKAIGNVQGAFGRAPATAAFLCLTGTEDIAIEGCKSAVNSTSMPALYANWEGGDHTTTPTLGGFIGGDPGTKQYMRLYTSWFRCFLADDQEACALFKGGADCPVCKEPGWAEIFAKNY